MIVITFMIPSVEHRVHKARYVAVSQASQAGAWVPIRPQTCQRAAAVRFVAVTRLRPLSLLR